MLNGKGLYMGTCVDGKWYRRYKKDKMFARGNGNWHLDRAGLSFHRYLTRAPMFIPFDYMRGLDLSKWHGGRWGGGHHIVVIHWHKGGQRLTSGFVLAKDRQATIDVARRIIQESGMTF